MKTVAREYGFADSLIISWVEKFNTFSVKGLKRKGQNKIYTTEQKEKMIHEVLNGRPQSDVTWVYGLSQPPFIFLDKDLY